MAAQPLRNADEIIHAMAWRRLRMIVRQRLHQYAIMVRLIAQAEIAPEGHILPNRRKRGIA